MFFQKQDEVTDEDELAMKNMNLVTTENSTSSSSPGIVQIGEPNEALEDKKEAMKVENKILAKSVEMKTILIDNPLQNKK